MRSAIYPLHFLRLNGVEMVDTISMIIDKDVMQKYYNVYFDIHPRAQKVPLPYPYHESINKWMIMKRPMMNALKQKWKDFIVWFVGTKGYANLRINKCDIEFRTFYSTSRRHDTDNSCPKFIIDGLCESGMIVDDDSNHVASLLLKCFVDRDRPRTEIYISNIELEGEEKKDE